jgi:hypothetical protein
MSPLATQAEHLRGHLASLATWLQAHRPLWQERPFTDAMPTWAQTEPRLAAWLRGFAARGPDAVDALHAHLAPGASSRLEGAPASWEALVAESAAHVAWAGWDASRDACAPLPRPPRIPDRKWREIGGFVATACRTAHNAGDLTDRDAAPWVMDWCAGKAHLGRTLAQRLDAPLWALDHDGALAADAEALARTDGVKLRFDRCDLLAARPGSPPGPLGWAIGLHACGGLGNRLLAFAVQAGARGVALAPCCLHRHHGAPGWPTLSDAARATGLSLDHSALRLATADEVVARPSLRARRRRDEAFRQAIDLRLRAVRGVDAHHPLGTLPAPWFERSFIDFAGLVSARLGIDLGPPAALEAALRDGTYRATEARALGAMRAVFRRPLELFAALDRALWLAEQGLSVDVAPFCAPTVTPRNLLIVGVRDASPPTRT